MYEIDNFLFYEGMLYKPGEDAVLLPSRTAPGAGQYRHVLNLRT